MQPESIFKYFNGADYVFCDPWAKWREIYRMTSGKPNVLHDAIFAVKSDTTDPNVILAGNDAADMLEQVIRNVFKMVPFDETTGLGATWPVCFTVWREFCGFMDGLKKKAEIEQPSSGLSDSQTDTPQTMPSGSA